MARVLAQTLRHAAAVDDVDTAQAILDLDLAYLNRLSSPYSYAPLHVAALEKSANILNLLLSFPDIDPNVRDVNSLTPLHQAASCAWLEGVTALLQIPDIDPYPTDEFGCLPLMRMDNTRSRFADEYAVARALVQADPTGHDVHISAKTRRSRSLVHCLLSRGPPGAIAYVCDTMMEDGNWDWDGAYATLGERGHIQAMIVLVEAKIPGLSPSAFVSPSFGQYMSIFEAHADQIAAFGAQWRPWRHMSYPSPIRSAILSIWMLWRRGTGLWASLPVEIVDLISQFVASFRGWPVLSQDLTNGWPRVLLIQ